MSYGEVLIIHSESQKIYYYKESQLLREDANKKVTKMFSQIFI